LEVKNEQVEYRQMGGAFLLCQVLLMIYQECDLTHTQQSCQVTPAKAGKTRQNI